MQHRALHVAITGASSGIGEALACAYRDRGARVTLVARRADRLKAIAGVAPERMHIAAADLSDVERAGDWIAESEAALGPIDVLVNNAGASMVHPFSTTNWPEAETLLRLNVLTPFKLTSLLVPGMQARGRGCIVDIASVAALAPQPGFFFYNASKAALAAGSESLRAELRPSGVHVLTVYPGPVHTPMAAANFGVFDAAVARYTPTGDARVLARLIVHAVEARKSRLIYPRAYTSARWFGPLARWLIDHGPAIKRPRNQVEYKADPDAAANGGGA
jgi:short-subunit dehydrogenase